MHIKSVDITTVEGFGENVVLNGSVSILDTAGQWFDLSFEFTPNGFPELDVMFDGGGSFVLNHDFLPEGAPDAYVGYVVANVAWTGEKAVWTPRADVDLLLSELDMDIFIGGLTAILKGRLEDAEEAAKAAYKAALV